MDDYILQLRKANLIESRNYLQTLEILEQIISMFQNDTTNEVRVTRDSKILMSRITYLKNLKKSPSSRLSEKPARNQIKVEEPFEEKVISIELDHIISPIIDDVYTMLMNNESIEYKDYLSFYKSVHTYLGEEPKPIVYESSEIAYFVGDTHGSYSETMIMITYFEKILQKFPEAKIIFLGDYVDRNPFDLENLTLIIAFWIKFKKNVTLIRGNHEDPKINDAYGFIDNLKENFVIEQWVDDLYGEVLKIFVNLPIIHILNVVSNHGTSIRKIFSVHGGIPVNNAHPEEAILLSDLEKNLHIPVNSYENFSEYLNWLLWADPKEDLDGFLLDPNTGRNQFGPDIFNQFVKANDIDIVVRAHEVLKNGFKTFFNDHLISLFSTSYYKNRKIGDGAFLRIFEDKPFTPLPIDPTFLEQDLTQF
ncbi:metallophosphoesterase [Candidatus Lokiarchaeum ossiferum]|uniref:metallophosphoesterase n=1 Tax=Candidatus Lokiarchaeum ossiferum TaxID=2951803 RepID=UPI00352D2E7E